MRTSFCKPITSTPILMGSHYSDSLEIFYVFLPVGCSSEEIVGEVSGSIEFRSMRPKGLSGKMESITSAWPIEKSRADLLASTTRISLLPALKRTQHQYQMGQHQLLVHPPDSDPGFTPCFKTWFNSIEKYLQLHKPNANYSQYRDLEQ